MGGHLRIDNALAEAIISAPLNGAQMKIVMAVFRLTIGWQRQTVRLTLDELAQYCGYSEANGGFREQRKKLLDAGVLEFAAEGKGRGAAGSYRLQTDPSRWGAFTPSVADLARWNAKPEHSDDQLPLRIMTVDAGGEKVPENRQAIEEKVPENRQASRLFTGRHHASLQAGKGHSTDAAAVSSEAGKTLKAIDKQPLQMGLAEAMDLLNRIEALKEDVGGTPARVGIRRERIRSTLGDEVDAAVRLMGGVDRIVSTDVKYRGVIIRDLAAAMTRIRSEAA